MSIYGANWGHFTIALYFPILVITQYSVEEWIGQNMEPLCLTRVDSLLPKIFFLISMLLFFLLPLIILIVLYALIAKTLMDHPNLMAPYKNNTLPSQSVLKYRKQVVGMLGMVVLAFFVCLLPFRAFTLWIIIVPAESITSLGVDGYYNLLYFCRIMFHINSAINPILYNIMSSKFRNGFLRTCGLRNLCIGFKKRLEISRKNTFNTTSSTNTSQPTSETFLHKYTCHQQHFDTIHEHSDPESSKIYVRIPLSTPLMSKQSNRTKCVERFV